MANSKSALKRIRQTAKRRIENRTFRNRARTLVKKAKTAVKAEGGAETSVEAVREAVRDLDKAASRGVIHPRNAARRKSRLMKLLAAATDR
jgi:small subunit ribosomal protein S20